MFNTPRPYTYEQALLESTENWTIVRFRSNIFF